MIGKIQRLRLRDVWRHEARDFTTWLKNNIDVLNLSERVFLGLALALVSVPLAYFATILAFPLWALIERTTGIEAMGRHFPSEWCFVATCVAVLVWLRFVWSKQRQ